MQLATVLFLLVLKIKIKIARHVIHLRKRDNIEIPRALDEEMGYIIKITGLSRASVYCIEKGSYCKVHGINLSWRN